jgi:hypothetical protein
MIGVDVLMHAEGVLVSMRPRGWSSILLIRNKVGFGCMFANGVFTDIASGVNEGSSYE